MMKDGLQPVGEVAEEMGLSRRSRTPQAQHHFTRFDQMNQLIEAREAEPNRGFIARELALCCLPRTDPGRIERYVRQNGPYRLVMIAGEAGRLPFGNIPRLLMAWVNTEVKVKETRVLNLGKSLSSFMKAVGIKTDSGGKRGEIRRFREQAERFFRCGIALSYKGEGLDANVSTFIAEQSLFWWDERKPDQESLWANQVVLSEPFFNAIKSNPFPLDTNTLKALKRSSLGLDLYLWLTYRTFGLKHPLRMTWKQVYIQFGPDPTKASDTMAVKNFRRKVIRELKKISVRWPSLFYKIVRAGRSQEAAVIFYPSKPVITAAKTSTRK